ncbi:MAG: peptidoglycan-binding protein, partial [Clostridia bacterium]|nr:peptidoglycan-binding protein [Clostridia bacterium]
MDRRIISLLLSLAFLLIPLFTGVLADPENQATPDEANKTTETGSGNGSDDSKPGGDGTQTGGGDTNTQTGGNGTQTGDGNTNTQTGGEGTLTGGGNTNTQTGDGNTTTPTGGDGTQTGGGNTNTQTGGDGTQTGGGNTNTQTGGDGTQTGGGNTNTQTGGEGTLTGGGNTTTQTGGEGTQTGGGNTTTGGEGTQTGDGTNKNPSQINGTQNLNTDDLLLNSDVKLSLRGSPPKSTDGVISGTVNITDDKMVMVSLYKGGSYKSDTVVTKASPTFKFENLEDGTYQVKFRYVGQESDLFSMDVVVEKSSTETSIDASAVGGINKITAIVNKANSLLIHADVYLGSAKKASKTRTGSGAFDVFDGLDKGTYTVKFYYDGKEDDATACVINNVAVVDEVTGITDLAAEPGEGQIKVSGKAAASQQVLIVLEPGSALSTVMLATSGTDGKFSVVIPCAASTYTTITAQYPGIADSLKKLTGSWTVKPSSVKPDLTLDTIYDTSMTVTGKTTPGVLVVMDDTKLASIADSTGLVKFGLLHTYTTGTALKFSVYYGTDYKETYTVTTTVAASTAYKELSYGSTGTEVKNLTKRLENLKYPIKETSYYDNDVVNAVRLFQSRNGLSVTGVANDLTQKTAYSTGAIPYDSYTYPTLVRGDRGQLVRDLQSRLKTLGYYTIKVDGIYGSGTQRAVRNFQSRNGLYASGVADSTTQQVLYSSSAIPAGGSYPSYYTTLSRSSRYNSAVVSLQNRLNALGYSAGTADGYFGSRTYRAVRNFQSRNGLPVTGVADVTTQQVLYSSSAIAAYYGTSTTTVTTYSTGYRLLYWGCTGDSVRRLQQALRNRGYTQITSVDGIYGKQTYDAVCAFQRNNGLTV